MSLLSHWMRHYGNSQKHYQTNIRHLWLSHARWARTHYQILGLPSAASQADIKKAYYALSMKHHPDKDDGCGEKFREITTAYEVLGNPRLRRLYDRGLLSDDQPDASVHYPTESGSGGFAGYSEEDKDKIKASVKTFDQWTEAHVRDTFYKNQHEKETLRVKQGAKVRARSDTAENAVIALVFLICVMLFSMLPKSEKGNKESMDDKKKKS